MKESELEPFLLYPYLSRLSSPSVTAMSLQTARNLSFPFFKGRLNNHEGNRFFSQNDHFHANIVFEGIERVVFTIISFFVGREWK